VASVMATACATNTAKVDDPDLLVMEIMEVQMDYALGIIDSKCATMHDATMHLELSTPSPL
jgi:hypothetical protein